MTEAIPPERLLFREHCDALLALWQRLIELGCDPRGVFDRPLCLFKINDAGGYEPSDSYRELTATLRRIVAERERIAAREALP